MQDINNILNSGDVPNLMRTEDLEEIGGVLRPMMQAQVDVLLYGLHMPA